MLTIFAFLAGLAIATEPDTSRAPDSCDGGIIECVVEGETLSSIAQAYGLDLVQITDANPQFSSNFDLIFINERVCIPTICNPYREPARCVGDILTLVEFGDTLYDLAVAYNLKFTVLIAVNPHLGPNYDLIFAGDVICKPMSCPSFITAGEASNKFECVEEVVANTTAPSVPNVIEEPVKVVPPRSPPSCDGELIQCVVPGDTLYNMAMSWGITLETLMLTNPQFADNYDLIFPGDRVCMSGESYPNREIVDVCDGDILTRVESCDTLYKLALENNLSLYALISANSHLGPNFNLIFPGDQVCKPKDCPPNEGEEKNEYIYEIDNPVKGYYDVALASTTPDSINSTSSAVALMASAVFVIVALMF
jgi:LysM repeat protein